MTSPHFIVAAVLLAVERVAYVWIYRRPDAFASALGSLPGWRPSPVDGLATLFVAFKLLQVAVFGWWLWRAGAFTRPDRLDEPLVLASGLLLVGAGQFLNLRVFQVLGRNGVFYGNRFGLDLPWRDDFPFSVMGHPQYVGTCLSIWGLFLVALYPQPGWYVLPTLETVYYVAGSWLEA